MTTIAENIQTLRSIKSDIKNAIIQKGGSVTDAFGGYAQAITDLPSGGGGGTENEDGLITRTLSGTYYNDRVSMVGVYALANCNSLKSIDLPLCQEIGKNAFENCKVLTNVSISNCNTILTNAFMYCPSLTSINLPKVSYIYDGAFAGCKKLKYLYFSSVTSVTIIYPNTFSKCPNLTSIYVPASLVDAFKTAENWTSLSDKIVAYREIANGTDDFEHGIGEGGGGFDGGADIEIN